MPLEYYVTVFSNAYDFIASDLTQVEVLRKEYVTFSENLLNYIKTNNKGNGVEIKDFFTSDILDKQSDIKFGQDTEMIDISKASIVEEEEKRPENPEVEQTMTNNAKVIFIIPFALPNSGKSHVWKQIPEALEKSNMKRHFVYKVVSSDDIRSNETEKLMK